jgi:hypothetical protein
MTSSNTTIKAVSDGTATEPEKRDYGLAVLRATESARLISLVIDALHQTSEVTHEMHGRIYKENTANLPDAQLQQSLEEALTCLQTADHYLRMLSSVLDERTGDSQAPWPAESPF